MSTKADVIDAAVEAVGLRNRNSYQFQLTGAALTSAGTIAGF